MREPKTAVIDGHTYVVQMLPGTKSWKMLLRIAKLIGPALGSVLDGFDGDVGKLMEADVGSIFIGKAISTLTDNMEEADVEIMIQQLSECTLVDNKPLNGIFDLHFQGNAFGVIKWLQFAIKANFGPFSSVLTSVQTIQKEQETSKTA